jgi:DNA-directed RNA polymerase alpha subunit
MKQTAVEWLINELQNSPAFQSQFFKEEFQQSIAMEKEQMDNIFISAKNKAEDDYEFYIQHLEQQNSYMKKDILNLYESTKNIYEYTKNIFDNFFVIIEKENKLEIDSKERISIYNVNMSKRVLNVLRSIDINYLDEISLWTKKELSQCRNVGKTILIELEKIMIEYNIKFRY